MELVEVFDQDGLFPSQHQDVQVSSVDRGLDIIPFRRIPHVVFQRPLDKDGSAPSPTPAGLVDSVGSCVFLPRLLETIIIVGGDNRVCIFLFAVDSISSALGQSVLPSVIRILTSTDWIEDRFK